MDAPSKRQNFSYPGMLPPYPREPGFKVPKGYHPYPFCCGTWNQYCPDPLACYNPVWLRESTARKLFASSGTFKLPISEFDVLKGSISFVSGIPMIHFPVVRGDHKDPAVNFYPEPRQVQWPTPQVSTTPQVPTTELDITVLPEPVPCQSFSNPDQAQIQTHTPSQPEPQTPPHSHSQAQIQTPDSTLTSNTTLFSAASPVSHLTEQTVVNTPANQSILSEADKAAPTLPTGRLTEIDLTPSKLNIINVSDPSVQGPVVKKRVSINHPVSNKLDESQKPITSKDCAVTLEYPAVDNSCVLEEPIIPENFGIPKELVTPQISTVSEEIIVPHQPVATDVPARDSTTRALFHHQPTDPQPPVTRQKPADLADIDDKPMKCNWGNCQIEFPGQRACLQHVKEDHIKSRKFADYDFTCRVRNCPCGGKVFQKRDNVISHVTNVAFDIRYAVCKFKDRGCKTALKREWDLPRHHAICNYNPDKNATPSTNNQSADTEGGPSTKTKKRGRPAGPSGPKTKKQKSTA